MRIVLIFALCLYGTTAFGQRAPCDAQSYVMEKTRAVAVVAPRAHWSYPGDIASHLATGHGQATAGMTREQMLDLHDALPEQARGTTRTVARVTTSNCPGGVCPTRTTTNTRSVTRTRWYFGKFLGR